jgi:hypothetical protein
MQESKGQVFSRNDRVSSWFAALLLVGAALMLLIVIVASTTQTLAPVSESIPLVLKQVNLVLLVVLAPFALLRDLLRLRTQVVLMCAFLVSGCIVGLSAHALPLAGAATMAILYIEVFWLIPRINQRRHPS